MSGSITHGLCSPLNHFQRSQDQCRANLHKSGLAISAVYKCSLQQTMNHTDETYSVQFQLNIRQKYSKKETVPVRKNDIQRTKSLSTQVALWWHGDDSHSSISTLHVSPTYPVSAQSHQYLQVPTDSHSTKQPAGNNVSIYILPTTISVIFTDTLITLLPAKNV